MKKYMIVLLCAAALFITGCHSESTQENAQLANPWSEWNTLQEAEAAIGFSFDLPETIAGSYVAESYRTMDGETKLLEVTYSDPDCAVTIRKAKGENQDISGVYDHDYSEIREWGNGEQMTFYRTTDSNSEACSLKILLDHNGYSWSIFAPNGFWGDSCQDFLMAIYE